MEFQDQLDILFMIYPTNNITISQQLIFVLLFGGVLHHLGVWQLPV